MTWRDFVKVTALFLAAFALPLIVILWVVESPSEAPSIAVEDSGGRVTATSEVVVTRTPAPAEGAWEALPTDHDVALGVLAAIPTTTTVELAPARSETRPVPSPDPAPQPQVQGGDSITDLICSYGWDCQTALRVFRCESGLNPAAVSPGGDLGIAQVNPIHRGRWESMGYTRGDMLTAGPNLAVAWSIWSEVGWRAWSCAR